MDKASAPSAFRGRGDDQWAFFLAADYADEWRDVRRPDGSAQGEGFGITYLEAALAARASIAAACGGQTDLILHGQTGWLLPPSTEALADLLWHLQEDPERVRLCGERALAHASRHFSPERQRRLLAELVEPWLGRGSPAPRP